jgi:hypothetical protein
MHVKTRYCTYVMNASTTITFVVQGMSEAIPIRLRSFTHVLSVDNGQKAAQPVIALVQDSRFRWLLPGPWGWYVTASGPPS